MKPVYIDSSIPEKNAKAAFCFPENIMMENAATALENKVLEIDKKTNVSNILILCGSGNNGGDGLALSRRLLGNKTVHVYLIAEPKTEESKTQYAMAKAVGVPFISEINWASYDLIVDCIFGTGFHGDFSPEITELLIHANKSKAAKLACDIPSGIAKNGTTAQQSFKADYTVTMGALKSALFSDEAKNLCGRISVANLGISEKIFSNQSTPDAYLIEQADITLPLRTNKSSHKGTYGHTVVYAGEKSGAAVLSASAAMKMGSGLTTLLRTPESNLDQFRISPSLMISDSLPAKTTAVVIGNGLGNAADKTVADFVKWFKATKNPACVIDADLFSYVDLPDFLRELNAVQNGRIVLTPHPKELQNLVNTLRINNRSDYSVQEVALNRMELGKEICKTFPSLTLVLKSANTFIINSKKSYICNSGSPALSKGGSGDVLAGMIGGLLAQGYSAESAAITATYLHGSISKNTSLGSEDFTLTSEDLINLL